MADITQTAANVASGTGAEINRTTGTAGETIVAGDVLYMDSTDSNKLKKAYHTNSAASVAVGVALNGGGNNQPIAYQTKGPINPGGTVVVGTTYCVSTNAGKFAVDSDVGSADYKTVLGIGISTTQIQLNINASGVAIA